MIPLHKRLRLETADVHGVLGSRPFCDALREGDLKHHVASINFEAGDHAIPKNPIEIAVALHAGRIAWDSFPYLECRYGERGKRFTSSDSCWLVTLARTSVSAATKSLAWLRTVLSSRGIPAIILEAHLQAISHTLAAQFPEEGETLKARFEPFLRKLDGERHALSPIIATESLIAGFEPRLRVCGGQTVDGAAQLIVAAWVDERSGISGPPAAVQDWFTDPTPFSAEWISTIGELLSTLTQAGTASC